MITSLNIIITTLVLAISTSLNPIKIIYLLITLRILTTIILTIQIATSWAPIIIFLIFIGGILISFIIIASMLPNEKSIKIKFVQAIIIVAPFLLLINYTNNERIIFLIKSILASTTNLVIFIPLIICYFIVFIILISQTSAPLRTLEC